MVFPVFWMISTAFKPNDQIVSLTPTWFSLHPTLPHFRDAMDRPLLLGRREEQPDHRQRRRSRSRSCSRSSPRSRSRATASRGRKLFIVLVIGIQMLPQAGLIIPLYVVLARYHQVNALTGVIVTYMTFVAAVLASGRCAAS